MIIGTIVKSTLCFAYTSKPDTIPHNAIYDFPAFIEGTLYAKDGSISKHLFNYNFMNDEMQLLTFDGDTLVLSEPDMIREIIVDSITYYYDKGYLRLLSIKNGYKIAVKKRTGFVAEVTGQKQLVLTHGGGSTGMGIGTIKYVPEFFYFIGDKYNRFVQANRKGFFEFFGEQKNNIREYIKANKINFRNEDHVLKVFRLCTE